MQSIRKFLSGNKAEEQKSNSRPGTMSFLQPPSQPKPTTKGRGQVALAPRHGLMDWIRKMNNTPNISGTNGRLLTVTEEELAKHNKVTDCWTAISGNVYNITPYLDYHPGGVDEIMKGAGIDATTLFQEIHSWVNFASMLEKCLVGRLVTQSSGGTAAKSVPTRLRSDFRQPDAKTLRLFIYTSCITLTTDHIFLHLDQSKNLTAFIYIDGYVHTISIELLESVNDEFNVRLSSSNKSQIEIDLTKKVEETWKSIGKFRSDHLSVRSIQDFQPIYFSATLINRSKVTHDTDWYTFSIPSNVFMSPPIGYHIRLRRLKEGLSIVKPYTVIRPLINDSPSSEENTIQLMIKHYPDRAMTPMLKQLNIGETIDMSACEGTFDYNRLYTSQTIILIAAGTGITPMISILNHLYVGKNDNQDKKVVLLFFNKTQDDILCRQQFDTMANLHKLTIHHILSQPDPEWAGASGHVRADLLQRLLPPLSKKLESYQTLVCVCGPTPFTKLTIDLLKEQGYTNTHLHVFLS